MVTLPPPASSLNHPVLPHHPILILNHFSVSFYSPFSTAASEHLCALRRFRNRCPVELMEQQMAVSVLVLPEPGTPGQRRGHCCRTAPVLLIRSCLWHTQLGPPLGSPREQPGYGSWEAFTPHHGETNLLFSTLIITVCYSICLLCL